MAINIFYQTIYTFLCEKYFMISGVKIFMVVVLSTNKEAIWSQPLDLIIWKYKGSPIELWIVM
jgi:hypothetical protein